MKYLSLLMSMFFFVAFKPIAFGQTPVKPLIAFGKEPKDAFLFTKHWAYPWYIVKDNNGKFAKTEDGQITAADTVHLYFTADCKTNVQGGYSIRYCYSTKKRGILNLNFSDGLPAYASVFNVTLKDSNFKFNPEIIYPELKAGLQNRYHLIKSKLIIYQHNYLNSNIISGYIDVEFTDRSPGVSGSKKYYFKGYFKTKATN